MSVAVEDLKALGAFPNVHVEVDVSNLGHALLGEPEQDGINRLPEIVEAWLATDAHVHTDPPPKFGADRQSRVFVT